MSELKVYHCNEWHNEYTEFYRKDEVKKVIKKLEESHKKEVGQLLMEIAELKAQKAQAEAKKYAMDQEAAGITAKAQAEAEAIRLKGEAEAAAMDKKAEALKKYGKAAMA